MATPDASHVILITAFAWILAQILKIIIALIIARKFILKLFFSTGGMPSSHSAIVSAMAIGMGMQYGFSSPFFAISLLFAFIVMHDAVKVRSAVGKNTMAMKTFLADIIESEYEKKSELLESIEKEFSEKPQEKEHQKNIKKIKKMRREIDDLKVLKVVLGHSLTEMATGALIGSLSSIIYFTYIYVK